MCSTNININILNIKIVPAITSYWTASDSSDFREFKGG